MRLLLCVACAALLACRGGGNETRRPGDHPKPPEAEGGARPDGHTVKIDPAMRRDLRITTAAVERRPGGEQVSLLGELSVDQAAYAEVGVPAAARVTRLMVGAGDTVHQGQPLAELTSMELGKARADYLSAAARVKLAEAALERKRGLAAEKILPIREVQEAESQAADASAAMRSARAAIAAFGAEPPAVDRDGSNFSTFVLRAPVHGTVIERAAVVGQMLEPAASPFRIGDLSTLWLTVHAFERDAVRIEQGAAARLVVPGASWTGLSGHRRTGGPASGEGVANGPGSHRRPESWEPPASRYVGDCHCPDRRVRRADPHRAGCSRAAPPRRLVRVPATGREHLRDPAHRTWP